MYWGYGWFEWIGGLVYRYITMKGSTNKTSPALVSIGRSVVWVYTYTGPAGVQLSAVVPLAGRRTTNSRKSNNGYYALVSSSWQDAKNATLKKNFCVVWVEG